MAAKIRTTKTRFAVQGYEATACEGAYVFDTVGSFVLPLRDLGNIANSVANTTVQGGIAVPQRMEIQKVWFTFNAGAAFSTTLDKFNLVVGTGAEAGTSGSGWAVLTAGQSVFASDQVIGTAGVSATTYAAGPFYPDVMTAWWDTGALMTLRLVTGSGAGTHINAGSIVVSMLVLFVDTVPGKVDAGPVTAPNF